MHNAFSFNQIRNIKGLVLVIFLVVIHHLAKVNFTVTAERKASIVSKDALNYTVQHQERSQLRICRHPRVLLDPSTRKIYKPITFQCNGRDYYNITETIHELAEVGGIEGNMLWGRQPFPIPSNKKILAIGNSHTRQVVEAFLCQYNNEIVDGDMLGSNDVGVVHFNNGASLYWLVNHWIVFTVNWDERVQEVLSLVSHSAPVLNDFDAIIAGDNNKLIPGSNFYLDMKNISLKHPDVFDMSRPGPDLLDYAERYNRINADGLLVGIGPFYTRHNTNQKFKEQCNKLKNELGHEGHSYCIDGRRYVDHLHHEMGADSKYGTSLAYNASKVGKENGAEMHRCAGRRGGMADLIVWDFVEIFSERLFIQ